MRQAGLYNADLPGVFSELDDWKEKKIVFLAPVIFFNQCKFRENERLSISGILP